MSEQRSKDLHRAAFGPGGGGVRTQPAGGVFGRRLPLSEQRNPMKLSSLKNNADIANKGRWQKDIVGLGDIELFVRGTSNPDYRRRMQSMIRALPPSKRKGGVVDPVELDRITGVCLLDHSLGDWKNVEGDDGKMSDYSYEQAKVFLTSADYASFRDGVLIAAMAVDAEDDEADGVTEKNS
ncbi:MAG TPA: hypothetical protein VHZ78_08555 [Rhizomicrobium sp.]|nr:hypothetical protein [Rhizomicrobium sp.]